jgi:hypothetical protein
VKGVSERGRDVYIDDATSKSVWELADWPTRDAMDLAKSPHIVRRREDPVQRVVVSLGRPAAADVVAHQPGYAVGVIGKPAGPVLVFDCDIRLSDRGSGRPIDKADVTVGADMPSMPIAHNVGPVKAKPDGEPGRYSARLELEMPGEWAVKILVAGPVRDQIIKTLRFEDKP